MPIKNIEKLPGSIDRLLTQEVDWVVFENGQFSTKKITVGQLLSEEEGREYRADFFGPLMKAFNDVVEKEIRALKSANPNTNFSELESYLGGKDPVEEKRAMKISRAKGKALDKILNQRIPSREKRIQAIIDHMEPLNNSERLESILLFDSAIHEVAIHSFKLSSLGNRLERIKSFTEMNAPHFIENEMKNLGKASLSNIKRIISYMDEIAWIGDSGAFSSWQQGLEVLRSLEVYIERLYQEHYEPDRGPKR